MANFLTRAVMGLFLSKKAQRILEQRGKARKSAKGGSVRDQAMAQIREKSKTIVTEDRAELIRQAMEVRRAKQTVLADLSDTEKQRLVAMAMKKLLNENK